MSLFIGTLAFEGPPHDAGVRLGVIFGSLVSAALGLIVLAAQKPQPQLAAAS